MLRFLSVRKRTPIHAPLFLLPNGLHLYQNLFTLHLQTLIIKCGLPPDRFSSHSMRIGAATTAATSGIPTHTVKSMGRWSSSAYASYVRPAPSSILDAQRSMASTSSVHCIYWWLCQVAGCITYALFLSQFPIYFSLLILVHFNPVRHPLWHLQRIANFSIYC